MTPEESDAIDKFCLSHNSIVLCEPCSGYKGKYSVFYSLTRWKKWNGENLNFDLIIHLGEVSGFIWQCQRAKEIWRVSEDGELRDLLKKLTNVFEMKEIDFFKHYSTNQKGDDSYLNNCLESIAKTEKEKVFEFIKANRINLFVDNFIKALRKYFFSYWANSFFSCLSFFEFLFQSFK